MYDNAILVIENHIPWINNSLNYFVKVMKEIYEETKKDETLFQQNKVKIKRFQNYFKIVFNHSKKYFTKKPITKRTSNSLILVLTEVKEKWLEEKEMDYLIGEQSAYTDEEINKNITNLDYLIHKEIDKITTSNLILDQFKDTNEIIEKYLLSFIIEQNLYEINDYFN